RAPKRSAAARRASSAVSPRRTNSSASMSRCASTSSPKSASSPRDENIACTRATTTNIQDGMSLLRQAQEARHDAGDALPLRGLGGELRASALGDGVEL